jgi:hypothetical protein
VALSIPDLGSDLDPDLSRSTLPRPADWRPLFGQVDRAQSHLRNQGVGPGDLFLFFGLFSPTTELPDGRLRYAGQGDWMHVLRGRLEVDWPGQIASASSTGTRAGAGRLGPAFRGCCARLVRAFGRLTWSMRDSIGRRR